MFEQLNYEKADFVFGTRYEKTGSDDDTIITLIGNFILPRLESYIWSKFNRYFIYLRYG